MPSLQAMGSLSRIEKRNLIEYHCLLAHLLPVHKRILFHLYYRDGYTITEISQLLMKNSRYIERRLIKITDELSLLNKED